MIQTSFWLCAGLLTVVTLSTQPSSQLPLGADDLVSAIAWGRSGRPEAYILRNAAGVPVGAVYTPYLRVALASRAALQSNRQFGVADVTPHLIDSRGSAPTGERIVYFAMRVDGIESPSNPEASLQVRVHGGLGSPSSVALSSGGTLGKGKRFGPSYLRFGLEPEAVYYMVQYPQDQLQVGIHVELFDLAQGRRWKQSTPGVVTASDLAEWK
jgi:hypothetical protein